MKAYKLPHYGAIIYFNRRTNTIVLGENTLSHNFYAYRLCKSRKNMTCSVFLMGDK